MPDSRPRKPRPPLDQESLHELALAYVARFATTRSKLRQYLARKLRERGWSGASSADVDALVERLAKSGFVDDRAYAVAKAHSLTRRGYGTARVKTALRIAGVDEPDGAEAVEQSRARRLDAALRFAERRRFGPFADQTVSDRQVFDRQLAAMIRAGHAFDLARTLLRCPPGEIPDAADLDSA